MSPATARHALDFIFQHSPPHAPVEIGFFGGEPLLALPLMRQVVDCVEQTDAYNPERVSYTVTTNGTVFSDTIATFLREHAFKVCISCDGAPPVQNRFRRTVDGKETAERVERTLLAAKRALPLVLVNAVYRPETLPYLPETAAYFSQLGLRHIFLNPDYSAQWTQADAERLPAVFAALGDQYVEWYLGGDPHLVSLLDTKLAVIVRGGYHPLDRCRGGISELTFAPDGGIYPCERLIGSGTDPQYRIGSLAEGLDLARLTQHRAPGDGHLNPECASCALQDLCMHWCSCSNAFMTGYFNRVGPFLCAVERTAIQTALDVFGRLEQAVGPAFVRHFAGNPQDHCPEGQEGGPGQQTTLINPV